jgi:pimeloyl-ACP methyl ester carboxylesterase
MTVHFAARIAERWEPASGQPRRGTVVVLPGRGAHGESYERLGRALSRDGLVVVALDVLPSTPLAELVGLVLSLESLDGPLVLLGSAGAGLEALEVAARAGGVVSGVVLVALPGVASGIFAGPVLGVEGKTDAGTAASDAAAIRRFLDDLRFAPPTTGTLRATGT